MGLCGNFTISSYLLTQKTVKVLLPCRPFHSWWDYWGCDRKRGTWDWDRRLGDVGRGDVGRGDVGRGDVGLGDVGLGDVGLGDVVLSILWLS